MEVSVVIPVYNDCENCLRAIESVKAQWFQDYEIILIDDGSTDGLIEKVPTSGIKYIRQTHSGVSKARNNGIENSRGKYIAFLDSDDRFFPDKLTNQVKYMDSHPEVIMSHTSYARKGKHIEGFEYMPSGKFSYSKYGVLKRCLVATSTVMVNRRLLSNLRFDENISVGEDTILWLKIAIQSPIHGIEQILSEVNIRENSHAMDTAKRIEGIRNVIEYAKLYKSPVKKLALDAYEKLSECYIRIR